MTKRRGFTLRPRREDIPDLDLAIADDHPINEQLYQLSALSKRQIFQGGLDAPAKGCEPLCRRHHIHLLLRLRLQLTQLLRQACLGLGHLLAFALEFVTANDLGQVDFQQPRLLPLEVRDGCVQRPSARLERLRQPFAQLRPLQFVRDQRGFGQDQTQVLPDQFVQCRCGGIACGTTFPFRGPCRIAPALAGIVGIAGQAASHAGELAAPTTDQPP